MTTPVWQQFQQPEVRALAWALFSEPLITEFDGRLPGSTESDMAFLQSVDRLPGPLIGHLANCRSHRLGHYFETLWSFYFHHHPDYQLLAHNLQVRNNERRTLGAFDFIYKYLPANTCHHLEVAVKFYLFTGGQPEQIDDQSLWPGPNPEDNLLNKVTRLQTHQLPLSGTAAGIAAIEHLECHTPINTAAALKGCLFYPWRIDLPIASWTAQHHQRSQWLYRAVLPDLLNTFPLCRWSLLTKREWLGERMALAETESCGAGELLALLDQQDANYPIMIARLNKQHNQYDEIARYFLTPATWPDK